VKLSSAQLATVARKAGVPSGQIPTAVAIALAESGGETTAHNAKPPDDSYGLWQINMLGSMGPARRKQLNMDRNTQLFDADTNARAMMLISNNGTNWRPWSTFTNGAYLKKMSEANGGAAGGDVPVSGDSSGGADIGSSGGSTAGITEFTGLLSDPGTWWRVGYLLGGTTLLLIGAVSVLGHTKAGRGVIRTVKKVAP
jgi:hypothetical protein